MRKPILVPKGTYAMIPGATQHTFENQGSVEAGFLSFTPPGGFEARMQGIEQEMAAADLRL